MMLETIADLGKSDKSQKRYRLWERPETNWKLKKPKAISAYLLVFSRAFHMCFCML